MNRFGHVANSLRNYFDYFINNADSELQAMYTEGLEEYDGGTYYSISGAIQDAYNTLCEHIEENNITHLTTKEYYKIDLEGVWQ